MNHAHTVAVSTVGEPLLADARAEVLRLLTQLAELLPFIDALKHGRQRGRGFLTHEGRQVLDRQVRAERRARHHHPDRAVGLAFLNGTHAAQTGTGEIRDLGTSRGIVVSADIAFTLHDVGRRLTRHLALVDPDLCPWPRLLLPHEPTVADLLAHLQRLAELASSTAALVAVARDLETVVEQARLAVHGHDRTLLGDPCPHCGVHSLVRYLDEGRTVCEIDPKSPSKFPHPCICPDPMCGCKQNPRTHRHEWRDTPKDKTQRSVHDLYGLINHHKEVAAMETRALDAINAIRELHAPIPIRPLAEECPVYNDPDVDHEYDTGDDGEQLCWTCPTTGTACGHCTHDGDDEVTPHPCPTLQHTVDIETPAAPKAKGGAGR